MTALADPPAPSALDLRAFLFGGDTPAAVQERLRKALEDEGVVDASSLPAGALRLLQGQLAEMAAGFLDVDLGSAAIAGWRRHEQLKAAALQTRASPELTVIVELATHRMTCTWRPRIEVTVGPAVAAHLTFELKVTFDLVGLTASVSGGRLTGLGGGRGTLTAILAVGGHTLAERAAPFDAHRSVALGRGVPLLRGGNSSSTPSVVEQRQESSKRVASPG